MRVVIQVIRKRRRKPDSESRALAQAGALDVHSSAMHLHQAPHNGQAQSQPAVPSGDAAVGLTKPVEDKGQEFGRNSDACVNYLDFGLLFNVPEANFHRATRRGELDRVVDQVPDHLLKPVAVEPEQVRYWGEVCSQTHLLGLRRRANRFDRRLDNRGQVGLLEVQRQIAGDDGRNIEQIVNQLFLRAGVALYGLQGALFARLVETPFTGERDPTEHGVERRAQLVRDGGEKFILQAVGLLGLGLRRLRASEHLGALALCPLAVGDFLLQRGGVALQIGVEPRVFVKDDGLGQRDGEALVRLAERGRADLLGQIEPAADLLRKALSQDGRADERFYRG